MNNDDNDPAAVGCCFEAGLQRCLRPWNMGEMRMMMTEGGAGTQATLAAEDAFGFIAVKNRF